MKNNKNNLKITQISAVLFKGDAVGNIIRANDKLFNQQGWDNYLTVDLFSEIPNVHELLAQDVDHTPLLLRLSYLFVRFISLEKKINYLQQYLKAKKHYKPNKAKNIIDKSDIRIWYYGGYYTSFSQFKEKDILFFVGITYPYLSFFSQEFMGAKLNLLAIQDMQPFIIVESRFVGQNLIDLGFKTTSIHLLPLFHTFNLKYQNHSYSYANLLTWGRYATNKAFPELAEYCNKYKLNLTIFGDNNQNKEFKLNYINAKKYENNGIKILPKQPSLKPFFTNSNIFISNSYHEGFLMPAIESMAHSLPILIRRGTAPDDFYTDKKHPPGLQFNNIDEIPHLIKKILNNYTFYSRNAYNLSKKYTIDIYKKRLFDILDIYLKWKNK